MKSLRKQMIRTLESYYQEYHKKIYSCCLNYCRNRDDAEDMLSETFIKISKMFDRYDHSGNFLHFAKVIAKNTCIDFIKKKNRRLTKEENFTNLTSKVFSNGFSDTASLGDAVFLYHPCISSAKDISAVESSDVISPVVKTLTPIQRDMVMCNYLGYTDSESAALLDLDYVGTFKSKFSRLRANLRHNFSFQELQNLVRLTPEEANPTIE